MALALGLKAEITVASGTSIPLTLVGTTATSGVLVLIAAVNVASSSSFSVSSSTLGSWGAARATAGASLTPIIEFTKPYTSGLTDEVVTFASTVNVDFLTLNLFEVSGAATSSYIFDGNGSIPVTGTGDPITGISTVTADDFVFAAFRGSEGSPSAGNIGGSAATLIYAQASSFTLTEYRIVSATLSGATATQTTGAGTANGVIADAIVVAGSVAPGSLVYTPPVDVAITVTV